MRKTILSILLALVMICTLLPLPAGADESAAGSTNLEDVTFGYAYDAQRNPAFPTTGQSVNLYSFSAPLQAGSSSLTAHRYSDSSGSWKLVNSGKYATFKNDTACTDQLKGIVTSVANAYSVNVDDIVIHSLKKDGTHVIYGVVVIYNATAQRALFLGDNWNNSGAGYLLSVNELTTAEKTATISNPVKLSATTTTTDYVKGFTLSQSGTYNFTAANAGYATSPELTVTVTNIGNVATGALTVELSGTNSDNFTLSTTSIESITNTNGTATFTVKPNTGLTVGDYTATVTVSSSGSSSTEAIPSTPSTIALDGSSTSTNSTKSQSFTVTFNVSEGETTPVPPAEPTHDHTRRQNTTTTTDTTPATTVASPKTGDMGIAVYAALSIMSVTGSAWIVGTKRRH